MYQLRELVNAEQLDYTKIVTPELSIGLVPVTCIDVLHLALDGLSAVRLQGFANKEAVEITIAERRATFYSRKRDGLWTKGEKSGDFLIVRAAYTDCDLDSVLLDVEPLGPTCHKGTKSCFEVPIIGE